MSSLAEVVRKSPSNKIARTQYATLLLKLNKFDEAIREYCKAGQIQNEPVTFIGYGLSFWIARSKEAPVACGQVPESVFFHCFKLRVRALAAPIINLVRF